MAGRKGRAKREDRRRGGMEERGREGRKEGRKEGGRKKRRKGGRKEGRMKERRKERKIQSTPLFVRLIALFP